MPSGCGTLVPGGTRAMSAHASSRIAHSLRPVAVACSSVTATDHLEFATVQPSKAAGAEQSYAASMRSPQSEPGDRTCRGSRPLVTRYEASGQAGCVCYGWSEWPINNPRLYRGKNPDLDWNTVDALANKIDRRPSMTATQVAGAGCVSWLVRLCAAGAGRMFGWSFGVVHSHHLPLGQRQRCQ